MRLTVFLCIYKVHCHVFNFFLVAEKYSKTMEIVTNKTNTRIINGYYNIVKTKIIESVRSCLHSLFDSFYINITLLSPPQFRGGDLMLPIS